MVTEIKRSQPRKPIGFSQPKEWRKQSQERRGICVHCKGAAFSIDGTWFHESLMAESNHDVIIVGGK